MSPQVQHTPARRHAAGRGIPAQGRAPGRTRATLQAGPLPGTVRVRLGAGPARGPADVEADLRGVPG